MEPLEKVLSLRPTNAVHRFGQGSKLPLLNPRDLVRAIGENEAAVLCAPIISLGSIGALMRAARDDDAAIGLACPYVPGDRDGPMRFSDAVRAAGDETRHRRPF